MSKPKAIFFDFDGTLLDGGIITQSAMEALRYARKKGVLIFAATGRNRYFVDSMPWLPEVAFDGFVTMNGTFCYVGDKILHKKTLHKDAVKMMSDFAQETSHYCMFCETDKLYASRPDPAIEAALSAHGLPLPPVRDLKLLVNAEICQMVISGKGLERFLGSLPHCSPTNWAEDNYDIVPNGVDKWVGILPMLAHFGLSPHEVAAVGDGNNDIEMLQGAGFAVAMGNGTDRVKACADYIAGDVDAGGVLEGVKWLLGC